MNTCGNCKLCCKLLGVTEIKKPPNQWCQHCDKTGALGCKIHDTDKYPASCHDFECGYLLSDLPEEYRPDRSHVIITGQENDLHCLFAHVDPNYPEAYRSKKIERVLNAMIVHSNGQLNGAIITIGDNFRILATDEQAAYKLRDVIKSLRK